MKWSKTLEDVVGPFIGKRIQCVELKPGNKDRVLLTFDNCGQLTLLDDGHSCCEQRFIHTDDDLSSFVGARLIKVGTRAAPPAKDEGDKVHEVAFLVVFTSKGEIVFSTHNKHNGYYGGFNLKAVAGDAFANLVAGS